jgi:hypothetical protein
LTFLMDDDVLMRANFKFVGTKNLSYTISKQNAMFLP